MRRAPSIVVALVLVLALVPATPARADSIVGLIVEIAADQTDQSFSITGDQYVFVNLSGVPASFFANNYAVLDAAITYKLADVPDKSCPPYLQIQQSDSSGSTSGARIRRSAAPQTAVQRVAIGQPAERYYMLRIFRATQDDVSTAGPCVITKTVAYTLRIRLYASTPVSTGLGFAPIHMPARGDGEPSIVVDRLHGDNVYLSAPVGIPAGAGGNSGGVDFWRSLDAGGTFSYAQQGNIAGGGDSHVVVDRKGDVFLADLGGAAVYVSKSADAGATFVNSTRGGANSDREWLATYTPPSAPAGSDPTKVFLSYHDLGPDNLPYECLGLNAGATFQPVCNPMATSPAALANSFSNTINGNQVFDSAGTIYGVFSSPDLQGDPTHPTNFHRIWLAASTDGILFANQLIANTPVGTDVGGLFPVIAVDKADNLYVVWAEHTLPYGPGVVKLSFSRDRGVSWSTPRAVSPTGGFAVLPWVAAGNAGQVEVTWVGTTTPSYNDPTANWYQYMSQSTNVLGGGAFRTFAVSPQPIRYGTVCLSGLLCSTEGDDGRILLDFTSNDIDSHCNAHVTYANSGPEPSGIPGTTFTDYARQRSGTNLCATVPPPPPPCDNDRQADGQGEIGGSSGSHGKFSFRACGPDDGGDRADYSDSDAHANFHSTSYTSVVHNAATHTVTINGTGTNGDHLVTFAITATDNGLSGLTDVFNIALSDGYQRGGTLVAGNVVVR